MKKTVSTTLTAIDSLIKTLADQRNAKDEQIRDMENEIEEIEDHITVLEEIADKF